MADGARWEAVADRLRGQIERGELPPGAQITPEAQLVEELGVSRSTVRRALQELVDEGLVTSGKGKLGRRVRAKPELLTWNLTEFENGDRTDTREADAWNNGISEQGKQARQAVTVLKDHPTPEVAEWLEIAVTEVVTVRQRVRYADDQPYQLSTSYFPNAVAQGNQLELPGDQSAPGGLLAAAGHSQRFLRDRIRGRQAAHQEVELLDLTPGTPVLEHVRIGYGQDHRPVRVMITIAPCDRWELTYDIPLQGGGDE